MTDIKENIKTTGVFIEQEITFRYFNKKLMVVGFVRFYTFDEKVDLYKLAVAFIKRLK